MLRLNLKGQRYGRLIVIKFIRTVGSHSLWRCRCDCGKFAIRTSNSMRTGRTRSCGCAYIKHGESASRKQARKATPEWRAWTAMNHRCSNKKWKRYKDYGGRGIRVCKRWQNSYEAFLADMGRKPSPKHSLDRIDNNGNYTPKNCRWATRKEQMNNRRR